MDQEVITAQKLELERLELRHEQESSKEDRDEDHLSELKQGIAQLKEVLARLEQENTDLSQEE